MRLGAGWMGAGEGGGGRSYSHGCWGQVLLAQPGFSPQCQGVAIGRPAGLLALSGVPASEDMVPPLRRDRRAPGSWLPRLCPCPGFWRDGAGAGGAQPGPAPGGWGLAHTGPQGLGGLPIVVQCPRPVLYPRAPSPATSYSLPPRWQIPYLRSPNLEPCHLLLA